MAAGKVKLYDTAKLKIAQGLIDLDGHAFKVALFLSTSNCNTLTHDELADLTNEHANANGYVTGGQALDNISLGNAAGVIKWDADDEIFTAAGGSITARFGVIYDDTVVGKPLVGVFLLEAVGPADVTATDGNTLAIRWNAAGIFTLSAGNVD